MRICLTSVTLLLVLSLTGPAQENRNDTENEPIVRFAPLHIRIDPMGPAMAAYQFELKAICGQVRIVGVEGGEHPAFESAPYYDPEALTQDRIIIAAFNTGNNLPSTASRVATIHLQILGQVEPEYEIKLTVASDLDSNEIAASITCEKGE